MNRRLDRVTSIPFYNGTCPFAVHTQSIKIKGTEVLIKAVKDGNEAMVDALLFCGADKETRDPVGA